MPTPTPKFVTPQLVSERDRWYVPVPWAMGDHLREALARLGFPSTLCLNPETREARLELWPSVSPPEFLAALEQLRGNSTPPLARATPVPGGPAEPGKVAIPTAQGV